MEDVEEVSQEDHVRVSRFISFMNTDTGWL